MENQSGNEYFRKTVEKSAEPAERSLETWRKYYGNDAFLHDYPRRSLYEAIEYSAGAYGLISVATIFPVLPMVVLKSLSSSTLLPALQNNTFIYFSFTLSPYNAS